MHEEKLSIEQKKKPKPPKRTQKRCELFIKILKYHDPEKAAIYEKEFNDLCQDTQEPIKENEKNSPIISEELIQDYCELLTNSSHRNKRVEDWKSYQLKSPD